MMHYLRLSPFPPPPLEGQYLSFSSELHLSLTAEAMHPDGLACMHLCVYSLEMTEIVTV